MMTATLTVTEHDPHHRTYVLDCRHATTTIDYLAPDAGGPADERALVLAALRGRHRESCACGWYIREEVVA
jgi:hypothetical protein